MKLCLTLLVLASIFVPEIRGAETTIQLTTASRAKDREEQVRALAAVAGERDRMMVEIRGILTDERATIFQRCFALEAVAILRLAELQDMVVPLVGVRSPLPLKGSDTERFVGAKAIASFGESGRSAVLKQVSGSEDDLTIECIAVVVRLVDGPERGARVVTSVAQDLGTAARATVLKRVAELLSK